MHEAIVSQKPSDLVDRWLEAEANGERFPVPFDMAWQIAGYSRKDSAKRYLPKSAQGEVYHVSRKKARGRPEETIWLSIEGFVYLLIQSNTPESKNILLQAMSHLCRVHFSYVWEKSAKDKSGFVYLVRQSFNGFYKIGKSKHPYKRLQSLQMGSPLELVIVHRIFSFDCTKLESDLHEYYQSYWVRGEWFHFPDEIVEEFLSVADRLDSGQESACFLAEGITENL